MEEDLLTLDQFIKQEQNRIKNNIKKGIKKEYNKKCSEKKISFNDYVKTNEYEVDLQNRLNKNKEYQRLFSDNIKEDYAFLERYHQKCEKLYKAYLEEMEEKRLKDEAKQKTIEFEDYLDNDKAINELLQKIYNNIELQYKEDIINYLRTSDCIRTQYYPFNHHYKFYEHDNKLNETTFDYFKECVNDNYWIENLLEDGLEQGLVETFALAVEMLSKDKKFNEFKMCADDNWNFHDAFIDIVTMWVDDPYGEIVYNLENYFDVEEIVNNLRSNENYKDMFEKIDNKEIYIKVMEESILHTIPNNIIDLYPLTRKMQRHFVLHIGETNSGKTYDAIGALKKCDKGIYLAPLRLLAYEQYDKLNNEGFPCSLITGEERMIVDQATYQSSTIEMLDILEEYDIAIIDEAQMLEDKFRGGFWTKAILGVRAHEIHICAAPQAEDILIKLISACHDTYEIVRHERNTQLIKETKSFGFPKSVQKGDALIVFSRKSVHGVANELKNKNMKASIIYGALPYDVRQNEARRFARGETDVVVATDAIGMGMNLPIKRIVFLEQQKYNGESVKTLSAIEVKQIAGRAGRYGVFDEGYVNSYGNRKLIYRLLDSQISPISKVYINFPESLIGIDAPISDILEHWQNISIDMDYEKANIDHELRLVKYAEEITDVKSIIYDFITMPFDEDDELLRNLWLDMLTNYCQGNHIKFNDFKNKYLKNIDYLNMESLEKAYKICDMIFYYDEKFFNGIDSKNIMNTKNDISQAIIKLLEKSKLQPRKCKYCGKVLPWNYQYTMCQQCHNERYTHYYNDYYDYY